MPRLTKPELQEGHVRVLVNSSAGSGYAEYVNLPAGTTVQQAVERFHGSYDPQNLSIKVNRDIVAAETTLRDGDRLSTSPQKLSGA